MKNDEKRKKLYEMKLFEHWTVSGCLSIRRVPGGWICSEKSGAVFVPFDNEFMDK